jgi:glucan phosphoethanolaminetransferase (alkaline phosphatase superfamily)
VKFDKRYWIFIAAAMFFATVASASTLYLASVQENFMECNSVTAACFDGIGMVPCMLLGILALLPLMVAIPCIFRQNERPGLLSVLVLGCIVVYTALDAVNNVSAIMGYHHLYFFAHTVLDTTNNVTGNVVGTGESHC